MGHDDPLSPVKRALIEIRELKARLAAAEASRHEPIAIVGMGCRLPGGVTDPQTLWQVLRDGVDTVREIPPGRWDIERHFSADPDQPGTMYTRQGGFLDQVDGFDAAFFGISPREADSMDPQQRLFLEVAWEALEHAAIAPDRLAGSATGVFAGVGNSDYMRLLFGQPEHIDAYAGSGGSASVIAGRLSYLLGLQGPSLAVDTACSASLVAVHLACQSLRSGECDLALAGGINLILGPEAHIAFTKARMLAPDGRCKAFDARADGYGRGEGCVVIALRRLSDAQTRGDRVLAVVRGSAVNQDGRSGGLTAPNGPAQEAVIAAALAAAGLAPAEVDVVEAHGTGTSLGDPIELQALGAALGAGRPPEQPLWVGSSKTNFGHLEAAAGITGLAKLVLALQHGQVPPHLHFSQPNPLIDWDRWPVRIATTLQAWPATGRPARAGVSSFGFSGTNAHVILEAAPTPAPASAAASAAASPPAGHTPRPHHLLALSAPSPAGLQALVQRHAQALRRDAVPLAAWVATANAGRAHFAHRLAVSGASAAELADALDAWLAGRADPRWAASTSEPGSRPVVGWLFTGQGAQREGMGRALYRHSRVFREALQACAAAFDPLLPQPLLSLMFPDAPVGESAPIHQTQAAQPALFALEYALATLWRHWGLEPAVVLGHSLGEITAACVAGVLPLPDAARLVALRGRLMQALPAGGAMANVFATREQVEPVVVAAGVEFAAFNGPQHQVITGPAEAVEAACAALAAQGVRHARLNVSHAFHSRLMEPMLDDFERGIAGLAYGAPRLPLVSNLSGRLADPGDLTRAACWRDQVRQPVRFADGVQALADLGVTHVVEIGPAPVLLGMAARVLGETPERPAPVWLPSLRGSDATPSAADTDWPTLLAALQALYAAGLPVRWDRVEDDLPRAPQDLPTYPFQRRRHWAPWLGADPAGAAASERQAHQWASVSRALDRQAAQAPLGVDVGGYALRWAVLERLTTAHAHDVLHRAGLFARPGERATVAEVRERLGAAATYDHLLTRWLQRLVAAGRLQHDGQGYVSPQALGEAPLAACQDEAARALADNPTLLAYLNHCGRLLPEVIAQRCSPLETLFPGGSFDLAEGIYERSGPARYINALAEAGLQALLAARGPGAGLRVLEIGAGTGGTSSSLIPLLPASGASYWFTDITPVFLDRAREKFARWPQVRFQAFDLEREAAAQGVPEGGFDLVVAANAVHAVRDLRAALQRLRGLLAPGGLLMLVESTDHLAWFDMSTGLIEGWQHFEDDLRDDNPLLSPARWVEALRDSGFVQAQAWPPAGHPASEIAQHLIVASAPGVPGAMPLRAAEAALAAAGSAPAAVDGVTHPATHPATDWPARLGDASPPERPDLLRELVRDRVIQVLRLDPAQPPGRRDRLMDLGFDSLMAVQLRSQLGRDLALADPLPATLMFDHPTIDAIAAYLLQRLGLADTSAAPTAPAAATAPTAPEPVDTGRAQEVAAMSDAEIEALLLQRLGSS